MLSFGSFVRGKVTLPRGIPLNWHSLELIIHIYIIKKEKVCLISCEIFFFRMRALLLLIPLLLHPLFQSGKKSRICFLFFLFQMDWKLFNFRDYHHKASRRKWLSNIWNCVASINSLIYLKILIFSLT